MWKSKQPMNVWRGTLTSLVIRDVQIKITVDMPLHTQQNGQNEKGEEEVELLKTGKEEKDQIRRIGEDVGQLELTYPTGGSVNWKTYILNAGSTTALDSCGSVYWSWTYCTHFDLAIPLLCLYQHRHSNICLWKIYVAMFKVVLLEQPHSWNCLCAHQQQQS